MDSDRVGGGCTLLRNRDDPGTGHIHLRANHHKLILEVWCIALIFSPRVRLQLLDYKAGKLDNSLCDGTTTLYSNMERICICVSLEPATSALPCVLLQR